MTTAMCTECGTFRTDLISPCPKCPGPPADDPELGFDFTDLKTPRWRLSEFRSVIKALASTCEDRSVKRLALSRYVQRYYPASTNRQMDSLSEKRADQLLETIKGDLIHRGSLFWRRTVVFIEAVVFAAATLKATGAFFKLG